MNKQEYFRKIYVTEVGKNPEHRQPKNKGEYITDRGILEWNNNEWEIVYTTVYPEYWLEEVPQIQDDIEKIASDISVIRGHKERKEAILKVISSGLIQAPKEIKFPSYKEIEENFTEYERITMNVVKIDYDKIKGAEWAIDFVKENNK